MCPSDVYLFLAFLHKGTLKEEVIYSFLIVVITKHTQIRLYIEFSSSQHSSSVEPVQAD